MKNKFLSVIITALIITSVNITPAFALTKDYTTTRMGNADLFDTAAAVSREFTKDNPTENCILCNPDNRLEDVSATPLSLYKNAPILLTKSNALNDKTKQALSDLCIKNVFLIGNTRYISKDIEEQLTQLGYCVKRFAGKDCFETNRIIMNYIPKDLWGPFPKIVDAKDWSQCLTIAVDAKYTYKWTEESPWNEDDYWSNYVDVKLPDGTLSSERKLIEKSKILINPIFLVKDNAWKNKDFKYIVETMRKINNWDNHYSTDPNLSYDINTKIISDIAKYSYDEYINDVYKNDLHKAQKKNPKIRSVPNNVTAAVNKALSHFSGYIAADIEELESSYSYTSDHQYNYYLESNVANNHYFCTALPLESLQYRIPHKYQAALLTSCYDFADCLLSVPLSAKNNIPIVLVDKSEKNMRDVYTDYLFMGKKIEDLAKGYKSINKIYYIGGAKEVPNGSEKFLDK